MKRNGSDVHEASHGKKPEAEEQLEKIRERLERIREAVRDVPEPEHGRVTAADVDRLRKAHLDDLAEVAEIYVSSLSRR